MRIIKQKELKKNLVDHPYGDGQDYHAAMTLVHLSGDEKLLIGYWEAPKGKVQISHGNSIEYNYVIRGRVTVYKQGGKKITAEQGDIIECESGSITYEIEDYAETLFIVYPQSAEDVEELKRILGAAGKVRFTIPER